ncbi:hypothetical protein PRK78_002811 [Emydomyces testavorans]|uniref:Uncharacterized protein n=1 Tax=Emydomyces testavorans TaxID=2070801 RepID=A0AAF0DF03_9EURO|nr:hypothetical protein PRK78_002811 [Emydomyces testavorans]
MLTELQDLSKRMPTPNSLRSSIASSTRHVKSWISTASTSYDPLFLENVEGGRRPEDVKGWPTEPAPLKKGGTAYFVRVVCDVLAIAATFPFFLLGAYAASRNGKPVNQGEWATLQEAMKVAVTTFPIVFSAVMGRMTRTVATWRLERGIALGQLEQLFWSSTVFSTLSTQLLLGSFNKLTVGLLVLWALSPLGGQSTLHIINTAAHPRGSNDTVFALNTERLSFFEAGADILRMIPTLNALYLTSLMAPHHVKVSPVDLWGNVKIPLMSHLRPWVQANSSGWFEFLPRDEQPYSSLIGIPIMGHSQRGNTTFNIETSYFDLDCLNLTQSPYVPLTRNITFKDGQKFEAPRVVRYPGNMYIGSNGTEDCTKHNCQVSFSIGMSHYVENWSFPSPNHTEFPKVKGNKETVLSSPPTLLFQAQHSGGITAYCNIKQIYVESAIKCIGVPSIIRKPQCAVIAMRDSLRPHQPSDINPFLFAGTFVSFSARIAQSAGQGHAGTATITERYLNDTENPLLTDASGISLDTQNRRGFSKRLTQVLNTYFLPSLLPEAMVGDLSAAFLEAPHVETGWNSQKYSTQSVPASIVNHSHDVYTVSGGWMATFILSSLAMFIAATVSAVVSHRTSIPDVLGYASSLTRDAKYFPLPEGGSGLDGLERSRILRDWAVRLGDVRGGDSEVGHLAFAEAKAAGRVRKGRLYE